MSDDNGKLLDDLGDLDWDSALDEWDKNMFVPEVARDAETNKAAPPVDEEQAREHLVAASSVGSQPAAGAAQGSLKDVSSEGTVIAPVPRELRGDAPRAPSVKPPLVAPPQRGSLPPPSLPPGGARGGLGQLFAKSSSQRPPTLAPPPPRAPSETTRIAEPIPSTRRGAIAEVEAEVNALDVPGSGEYGALSSKVPSVTVQLRSPSMIPPEAYPISEGDPTLVGRGLTDAEQSAGFGSETLVAERSSVEPPAEPPFERLPADDEAPTFMRSSDAPRAPAATVEPAAPEPARERPPAAHEAPVDLEGERPVSRWLDEATATSFRQRASWLEEEARALIDSREQARALLGVSELLALVGDESAALGFAIEARDLAPHIALSWRQARHLMPRDADTLVDSLDAEAARSPTPAARAHAMLMAADVLRTSGDGDGAVERWDRACKLDPADVRAPAARAALALSQGNHTSAGTDLAENSELIALDKAVSAVLKLRGVPRPGTDVEAMPINDGIRRARAALVANDVVGAALAVADISAEPALAKAALWLSSALGTTHIAGRRGAAKALKTLVSEGEDLARRPLAARGIELADGDLVAAALANDTDTSIDVTERAVLLALSNQDVAPVLAALALEPGTAAFVDALSAITLADTEEATITRSRRAAGTPENRALAVLGRLLASRPAATAIDEALADVQAPRGPAAAGVALEVAVRTRRWDEVSAALSSLPASDDADASSQRHIAAALVAERAGNAANAKRAWREALDSGAAHDSIVRAVASTDPEVDLAGELLRIAETMPDGPPSALLRLEALARREAAAASSGTHVLGDDEQAALLERIHRGAPALGIGAFLAERLGRRTGDVDEVLRWLQERRSFANDSFETALDSVREALLVAERDADLASTRLEEAHRARPDDVALRELYERLASEPPPDRGAWRERRATQSTGTTQALLFTEAALEHERAGDPASALRAAQYARQAGDIGLSKLAEERAEIATGATTRQTEELLALADGTEDEAVRLATYERLAELDAHGRKDLNGAVAWHRKILATNARYKPSLRFLEQKLIGDGLDHELVRVFEWVALALDGTAGGEVTGHAQLAARIKTRVAGGWEDTSEMARLAATQPEPSLWALRALNAHARVQKDEEATLSTTVALLERTARPPERAALLLRASEASARLEQVEGARTYLEQAANEDPGDVVTWGFLAEVRERTGESRAAADACESLARTSAVPEHQVLAWFDAARLWLDAVKDPERGMTALEQCAEVDVTHADVFQRLSALYAEKSLDAELARLLEKRLAIVDDEGERVGLEVELARALGEMGELAKAKGYLESALAQRPDHSTALGAMAELCAKEGDWAGAEQAYVRLARLLVTPEEQSAIYEKLGEIYVVRTVNLSRAEVAYKEVLKRNPGSIETLEKLIDIYKRQGDVAKAVETQQQIVAEAQDPNTRLQRLIDLAAIHETTARDARRAEQVLESARKEFPTSVVALRAMAEFYSRQRQMPAMQILLDRAASDARRSFAAGRFVTSLFEVLHAAYELRGRKDAARVVAATLAAVEGPNGPGRVNVFVIAWFNAALNVHASYARTRS